MLLADDVKSSAAFLNASSLPPIDSCESNACTDTTGGGFVTIAADKMEELSEEAEGG